MVSGVLTDDTYFDSNPMIGEKTVDLACKRGIRATLLNNLSKHECYYNPIDERVRRFVFKHNSQSDLFVIVKMTKGKGVFCTVKFWKGDLEETVKKWKTNKICRESIKKWLSAEERIVDVLFPFFQECHY